MPSNPLSVRGVVRPEASGWLSRTTRTSRSLKELTGRIGKYEIVRPLGKGAMGQVYLAHDTVLDRDVALKVMVAQIADDPELKQPLRARGQGRREDDRTRTW